LKFQELCTEVPKWNQDTIDENVNKLLDSCRCDYLEELMAAVFIAHTKVLIAIRVSSKHKKLQITLPKLDHFIHRVFAECARGFWKAPFLFQSNLSPIEMQKNLLQAEMLCNEGLSAAVRSLLPIKNILNEYLSDEVGSSEPIVEDVVQSEKESEKEVVEEADEKPKKVKSAMKGSGSDSHLTSSEQIPDLSMLEPVLPASAPIEHSQTQILSDSTDKIRVTKLDSAEEANTDVLEPEQAIPEKKPVDSMPAKTESSPDVLVVDTKPSVHFNNYDNVFDESNSQTNPFKYAPKDIEPGEVPLLEIKDDLGTPLSLDASVTSLEPPGVVKTEEMSIMADTILD
jgi:hypothetical protein